MEVLRGPIMGQAWHGFLALPLTGSQARSHVSTHDAG